MIVLILLNSLLFLLLALLHIYWAFGGQWALDIAIPATRKGKKTFKPGVLGPLTIASGLLLFGFITIANSGIFYNLVETKVIHYGNWAISIIFLLRAIGDFKFVGFAKRIRHTDFALYDTKIYSPLAFAIATISFVIGTWS
ncbi:MAG: hypothetical protein JWM28_767 [Chitinophagaceae bacterium]|nr:hypothetical protein [Chitinophagaceae bacterium]